MLMANDNNKINKLVSTSDDDPTAELEIPAYFPDEAEIIDHELEADANTFEFEQADVQPELDEQSIAALKSGLKSRTERINRLQFDIEQLRAKWTGLEKEIEAREEITKNLQDDINQLNGKLSSSDNKLGSRKKELDEVKKRLESTKRRAKKSSTDTEQLRKAAKKDKSKIRSLDKQLAASEKKIISAEQKLQDFLSQQKQNNQKDASHDRQFVDLEKKLSKSQTQLADLRQYVDGRKDSWTSREDELSELKLNLEKSSEEIEKLAREVENRDTHLKRNQTRIDRLSKQLATQVSECKALKSDNRELKRVLHNDAEKEIENNRALIAEQSGRLKGDEHEIRELVEQASRSEEYSNDLRCQLQKQTDLAAAAVSNRQELQTAIELAQKENSGVSDQIEHLQLENKELAENIASLQDKFAEEARQIRFELGAAQETIADQASVNEQLASDLIDNKGFRQALETQLNETEEGFEKKIQNLEQEAKKLKTRVEDYEDKVQNKDQAIAALMNEIASRSQTIESIGEIENVIHEIDDRMSERFDEQNNAERERVTRLLIGKTDGQELRFPLFKDRLTIGRTSHNDIQLKAQFISRRHAVIVTENGSTRIVDWGSKNGVFINEKRIAEQMLKNGDVVTIGTTDFRYEERPKR